MVIGLTGGIACGKSAAAQMFADGGAYIIDTDVISREAAAARQTLSKLKAEFGFAFDGEELNRARLREAVFADVGMLKKLNEIMHPIIKEITENRIEEYTKIHPDKLVVVVAPLLFEAGFDKLVNKTVTVSCSRRTRIERLIKRDNITCELAESMINSQLTDDEREKRADTVLNNDGSLAQLRAQVIRLCCEYK